jgi:hypothetical protein
MWSPMETTAVILSACHVPVMQAATSEVGSILQQQLAGTSRYKTGEGRDSTPDSGG